MELGPQISTISVLAIGFALGLQHSTEADHLAAIATIVSEKKDLLTASLVGGLWGLGHTAALLVVGLLVVILRFQISSSIEAGLEACVGGMLVLLGLNAIRVLARAKLVHVHSHDHDGHRHVHIHTHGELSSGGSHHRLSPRAVIIGMVHGLAGSAALMLLVVPTISSRVEALLYIAIFGIGSVGGMMAMSFLIGLPFHFTAGRLELLNRGIRLVSGIFSLGLGSFIVYEKLFT